jgi:uncharacterized protein (DUF927 family)
VRKLFLCTKGQATRFAVLCSLAAPLMDLMDQGEGGSILALFTPNSSTGKTLTLTAAATVWGDREALESFSFHEPVGFVKKPEVGRNEAGAILQKDEFHPPNLKLRVSRRGGSSPNPHFSPWGPVN